MDAQTQMNYETTSEIEIAVARWFGTIKNIIVPNTSWGMFHYELDLCILNYTNLYAKEVEIKISKSDLKRDLLKKHNHDQNRNLIRELWFAMPKRLVGNENFVPTRAGILYVNSTGNVEIFRKPQINKSARKWSEKEALKLARLGTIRVWNMKEIVNRMIASRAKEKELAKTE